MSSVLARRAGLGALLLVACRSIDDYGAGLTPTPARGMVVSAHPLATEAGVRALEAGGNAADAAVATALALAVVYPQAGNLGGGGFALWVPGPERSEEEPVAWDFRETAPAALRPDDYLNEDGSPNRERMLASPFAAGVPGSPRGLWELHAAHGELEFAEVAERAIELARDGYAVDPWLVRSLESESSRRRLTKDSDAAERYYPAGRILEEGAILRQPHLARTLELLVERGPDGFYAGPVADAIVAEMENGRGRISHADLLAYRVERRAPLRGWFRGHEVLSMPPPSSGGVVLLQALAILERFSLDAERARALEAGEPHPAGLSERALHLWIETMRRGFADRAEHMGDPGFHDVPVEELLAPAWIAERASSIGEEPDPDVAAWLPTPRPEGTETTHLSVLDAEGNALSMTTTLNTSFGCGEVVAGAGFLLNNEMDDFSLPDIANTYGLVGSEANWIEAGKRPLSSMTPTVLRRGNLNTLVIGSPGGPRIITSVLQVLLRHLVSEQPLDEAVAAPRLHQQWRPESTWVEPDWDAALLEGLRARGHALTESASTWSSVQAIACEPGGEPVGASDPRRGGTAWGVGRPRPTPPRPPLD